MHSWTGNGNRRQHHCGVLLSPQHRDMTHLMSPPIYDSKTSLANIFLDSEVPHRPVARPRSPRRRGRGQLGRHSSGAGPGGSSIASTSITELDGSATTWFFGSACTRWSWRRRRWDVEGGWLRRGRVVVLLVPRSVGNQASRLLIGNLEGRLAILRVGSRGRTMSGQIAGRRGV